MPDSADLFPRPRRLSVLDPVSVPAAGLASTLLDPSLPERGYALTTSGGRIEIRYADDAGLRYARQTLAQLTNEAGEVRQVEIEDWPDFPVRGFMLDISRDRVPTRDTLVRLIDLLEVARINQFQLYTEHTFAYRDHDIVWADASPLTAQDVLWLDEQCRLRGIELVPNQNVFGHMERWLRHDPYRFRAESPGGYELAGMARPAAVLEPTQENAGFVLGLLEELLPLFHSRSVNIGADETFELGLGRSRERVERVEQEGRGAVYIDYVLRVMRPLLEQGYEVQYWADILTHHPEYAAAMPPGSVPIVWLYDSPDSFRRALALPQEVKDVMAEFDMSPERQLRGFADRAASLIDAGISFWVAPGTSTWLSLVGRIDNATENMVDAARTGLAHGSGGYLNTQWGELGMIEPPSTAFVPIVFGGAVSWSVEANADLDVVDVASRVVFEDETGRIGTALDRLGRLWATLGIPTLNSSPLFQALVDDGTFGGVLAGADSDAVRAAIAVIDAEIASLQEAAPACDDGPLVVRELTQAARLARLGAELLLGEAELTPEELDALLAEQRACWLARSRPGGLEDSIARLDPLRRVVTEPVV